MTPYVTVDALYPLRTLTVCVFVATTRTRTKNFSSHGYLAEKIVVTDAQRLHRYINAVNPEI